jgi:hypothetical protein
MYEATLHRLADRLLARLVLASPAGVREWGAAMRGELAYIAGGWSALAWAVGGSVFLLRCIVTDRFRLVGRRPTFAGGGIALTAREGSMQKSARWIAVACLVLSLLFFLAPTFRQALGVATSSWQWMFRDRWGGVSAKWLNEVAGQARRRKDAAGMAFVALQLSTARTPGEDARLADEAVALDSRLTWIYAAMAEKYLADPKAAEWISRVAAWDPDNAVSHLLTAQRLTVVRRQGGNWFRGSVPSNDEAWLAEMDAAFRAPKYDSYSLRQTELEQAVIRNYRPRDPLQLVWMRTYGWSTLGGTMSITYLPGQQPRLDYVRRRLLAPAKELESKGKISEAGKLYWIAARFGERVYADAPQPDSNQHWYGMRIRTAAYERLLSLAEKSGNQDESAHLKYLLAEMRKERGRGVTAEEVLAEQGWRWYAMIVQVSFLVLLVAGVIVLAWALHEAARRFVPRFRIARLDTPVRVIGAMASLVMFAASVSLYVSYRPFAELFSQVARLRVPGFRPLSVFFNFVYVPSDVSRFWSEAYLWWAVIVCGTVALAAIALRNIARLRHPHPAR